ncbi:MAG TPA: hypothetical protein VGM33_08960 [Baekduia sp.]
MATERTDRARRRRWRAALGGLAAALALTLAVAGPAQAEIGISDSGRWTFTDWRFTDLGITDARLVVPWDVALTDPGSIAPYLSAAAGTGMDVHVAFEHAAGDSCPGTPCGLPSVADYRTAVDAFRARWPWVTSFAPWNEASHETQPTMHAPARAAAYFDALSDACPGCTIVAADVLGGDPGLGAWLRDFRAAAVHVPALWGLHDYGDADRHSTADLDGFLALVPGPVWITETGGIVQFTGRDGVETMPYDEARAARGVGFALAIADAYADRVPRVYLHSFTGGGRMDTGLVGPEGATRRAYDVVLDWMRAHAVAPRPRPPGKENAQAPLWDQRGSVDPRTGAVTDDGADRVRGGVPPHPVSLRSPRLFRRGVRGVQVKLACPAGGPTCRGHVVLKPHKAAGCRSARYAAKAGRRTTVLVHCRHRPRSGAARVVLTQHGLRSWTAKARVR